MWASIFCTLKQEAKAAKTNALTPCLHSYYNIIIITCLLYNCLAIMQPFPQENMNPFKSRIRSYKRSYRYGFFIRQPATPVGSTT
jgi:hypothetical protein